MTRLILVLGDQLSQNVAALREANCDRDVVVMAEVAGEASYVPHHPKKIALVLAAMRKFAKRLREEGWTVAYTELDDTENTGSIPGELIRRASQFEAKEVIATEPGEWRLIDALNACPLPVRQLEDDRFIASHAMFDDWAKGRKTLRMEYFYREMRRETGLLMEEGKPAGGQWNFDHDNRKPAKGSVSTAPLQFTPDEIVTEVLDLVEACFSENFGELRPFWFATDREQALKALSHFVATALPKFGDYQDAMMEGEHFLWHAHLSAYINLGLLSPLEVCRAVEEALKNGEAPINAAEGFIRQIIGWREYVRGIYYREGPSYTSRNYLKHNRDLPWLFWGGATRMRCVEQAVRQTNQEGYAHHIQRLMVTGNFALLAGIDPAQVHQWYLSVYVDAFEWVEAPNTIGMSQFADGGVIASKPYVSSGNYIDKMSDHCRNCSYDVKGKDGEENACPFNHLYWHFLNRHRDRFEGNGRMGNMYRAWDKMNDEKQHRILHRAESFLKKMETGDEV